MAPGAEFSVPGAIPLYELYRTPDGRIGICAQSYNMLYYMSMSLFCICRKQVWKIHQKMHSRSVQ